MDAVVTRILTFCVSVCYKDGCSGYTEANSLRIRMLQKWMQWLHGGKQFAYPYATKMDAVVTRMLTFCVSVCYKNRCSGYTDVNILRIRMLKMDAMHGFTEVNILRIRMLLKWMQWLHGY